MAQTIDLRGLVRPQLVEATKREDNPNVAEFRLQPLERGFGHTLGNAMRRMLLSSLRGSAIWAFRIDGVVHEHQTIPGVVEDVHQIIGNLKTLTLSLEDGLEDALLRIQKTGPGAVTAADIVLGSGVRVIDPQHHLFTLQDDREIHMDLYAKQGRGYTEADQHVLERGMPIDVVRIDAIYNPVRRANFAVAETRVGQRTDYDRLTLTVETNGTITPEEAVSYAAALAQTHFQYFVGFGSHVSAPVTAGGESDGRRLGAAGRAADADRRSRVVRAVGQLTQEFEHSVARRPGPADGEPDPAGQELRQEVAAGDRGPARAQRTQLRHAVRGKRPTVCGSSIGARRPAGRRPTHRTTKTSREIL